MLRYLEKNGITIGINWYLTENDSSNDGKFITYLDNNKERYRDPELFDLLKESRGIKTVTGKEVWDTKTIQIMLKNEKYKGDTMLQKTFTEDFMTGKKSKNIGQRSRYYVKDSHSAIVSAEIFDKVQEEMDKRARFVSKEDGSVETSGSRYNGKYLLGNLLVCGDCRASYRRRTERGKVVWRCATRIEKGKEACHHSPTLDEGWLQNALGEAACQNGVYDENVIRSEVEKVKILIHIL